MLQYLSYFSSKIDETLSESINILKNDYDQKIADAQADLDNFKQVSLDTQESSERRLEDMMINKIKMINLIEICHPPGFSALSEYFSCSGTNPRTAFI